MSTMRDLTAQDYWLLDVMVDAIVQVEMLHGSARYLREQWNRSPHHMSQEDVHKRLKQLEQLGCISIREGDRRELAGQIDSDAKHSRALWASLTSLGGELWEEWAEPDWDRHFYEVWHEHGMSVGRDVLCGECEIYSTNMYRLNEVLDLGENCWGVTFDTVSARYTVDTLSPYSPTYWKTLQTGLMCRVPFRQEFEGERRSCDRFWKWTARGYRARACEHLCSL